MNLSESTWTDADAADADLALLPVGSTEQHGPHAPLGTDTLSAEAVADAGATAAENDVIVAPPIPVGIAAEHRQFTGTLWVSPDTFRAYVRETVASLASHGWDRVVIVNGHGGNAEAVREVAADLTRAAVAYTLPFTWFDAVEAPEMGHGGPVETALLRHVAPDLVREDRIEEAADGAAATWGEWVSGTNLSHDSAAFSENGAVGDPRDGDADRGEELLAEAGVALADLLAAVADRDPTPPPHR